MTLKVFTCLLCGQEYNKLDKHNCLDRVTPWNKEVRGITRLGASERQEILNGNRPQEVLR